jgi:two-component system NtrC family response regulator
MAVKAAQTNVNVLLTGETGTGKEILSEMIHQWSSRHGRNFIVVDCAALPEHLVESTLYGHEKGAFTGAERDRRGLVQEAGGGTLFLDEIGELPLELQKRFLRVLDTRKFRKVGGQQELTSDFRLIAATNRDLDEMVARSEFRADLLHRIRTLQINLPPLRDRPEDIEPLAQGHLKEFCEDMGQPVKKMSPRFLSALREYAWPGNVRELFNSIERAVADAGNLAMLQRFHLPVTIRAESARKVASRSGPARTPEYFGKAEENDSFFPTLADYRRDIIVEAEAEYLRQLISRSQGDVEKAVSLSGLSRSRLYALLKNHGLSLKM